MAAITTLPSSAGIPSNTIMIGEAGAGNTLNLVREIIAGVEYKAYAIEGNEDLEKKLSVVGAQLNWKVVATNELYPWSAAASHLYHKDMFITVESQTTGITLVFRPKDGATLAQLFEDPSDPAITTANSGYTPWSFN